MTRTTLKALWVGGGGVLATWLAVAPNNPVPAAAPVAAVQRSASPSEPTARELNAQAARLTGRMNAAKLLPSTRNPFRFNPPKHAPQPEPLRALRAQPSAAEPAIPPAPMGPVLKLSGIAQTGGKYTAIISGDGRVYLVGEGESVGGRFTVTAIDPEAVLLRDTSGAEQRLVLPQ